MATEPTKAELWTFSNYLDKCEWAAPPPVRVAQIGQLSFEGLHQADTFGDVSFLRGSHIDPDQPLPEARDQRILKLRDWMEFFPAYRWLKASLLVKEALASFRRIQKRERSFGKLNDDLSEFRFWRCAVWAAILRTHRHLPSPDFEQRKRAKSLARSLSLLCQSTQLLRDVELSFSQQRMLLRGLDAIQTVDLIGRRRRSDAHSSDREFVELLTDVVYREFSIAPPSIITWLAAMKIKNPDKVHITKLVALRIKNQSALGK
jgi:hypothetical protein